MAPRLRLRSKASSEFSTIADICSIGPNSDEAGLQKVSSSHARLFRPSRGSDWLDRHLDVLICLGLTHAQLYMKHAVAVYS
jgi:hypothetical protein